MREMHVGGAFTEVVSLLTPGRGLHVEAAVGWPELSLEQRP